MRIISKLMILKRKKEYIENHTKDLIKLILLAQEHLETEQIGLITILW